MSYELIVILVEGDEFMRCQSSKYVTIVISRAVECVYFPLLRVNFAWLLTRTTVRYDSSKATYGIGSKASRSSSETSSCRRCFE